MIIVKIYLGISLELLRVVWSQFSFRQFLVPAYTSSQGLQVPFSVVHANYRVLICCTCHFQSGYTFFVYFGFVCLQISSVSNFHPDTGSKGDQLFRLTCSAVLWRVRNTANKYRWHMWRVLTVYGPDWVCPSSQEHVLSGSTLLRLWGALQGTVQRRPRVSCTFQV